MGDDWVWIALGVDAALSLLFYTGWKKECRDEKLAKEMQLLNIGVELEAELAASKDRTLSYACIEGVIEPVGPPLKSMFKPEIETGVIQRVSLVEHRSRRMQGYWTDSRRVIRDITNKSEFQLGSLQSVEGFQAQGVLVEEPLRAEYLMHDLKVTYDKYTPNTSSMVEKGVDRLFGDYSRGFQETEKMLNVGVRVMGLGRVVQGLDGRIRLTPPEDGQRYILTTLTKAQALRSLRKNTLFMQTLFVLSGAVGTGLLCYMAWRRYQAWRLARASRQAMDDFRRHQEEHQGEDGEDRDSCVVCLAKAKDVVLLDCGHICLCADCAASLPKPKSCPVCRQPVARIQPVFIT